MSDNQPTIYQSRDEITVPFGKYKGKPVSVMMSDSGYIKWLKQQDWFNKQHNLPIYNIIIHQQISGNGPSRTQAHNKMQNLFLEPNTIKELYHHLTSIGYFENISEMYKFLLSRSYKVFSGDFKPAVTFESKGNWDLFFERFYLSDITLHGDIKERLKSDKICDEYTRLAECFTICHVKLRNDFNRIYNPFIETLFEDTELHTDLDPINSVNNIKSHFTCTKIKHLSNSEIESKPPRLNGLKFFKLRKIDEEKIKDELYEKYKNIILTCSGCGKLRCVDHIYKVGWTFPELKCELKPSLSDDYPEVLRKMRNQIQMDRNSSRYLLIVEKFTSDVCSIDQLRVIFKQHNITVLLLLDFLKEKISSTPESKILTTIEDKDEIIARLEKSNKEKDAIISQMSKRLQQFEENPKKKFCSIE